MKCPAISFLPALGAVSPAPAATLSAASTGTSTIAPSATFWVSISTPPAIVAPRTPIANLYVSMLGAMGVEVEKLGDSTGRIDGLGGLG